MHTRILTIALLLGAATTGMAADSDRLRTRTQYDAEYPVIDYSGPAIRNRVSRVQQQLQSGELQLAWDPKFGYLKSLMKALDINEDSQVLVFSRTSLQVEYITGHVPRAIYFNDDTYIGYVQDSPLIEIATIDSQKGAVFYSFDNRQGRRPTYLSREGSRCLSCHDTFSQMGGGVPRVMVMSAPVEDASDTRDYLHADETDDRTPLAQRWGGWYVTGRTGAQTHFGNLALRDERAGERLRQVSGKRGDIDNVRRYVDRSRWPTDQSDVVALLVLEHQTYLQNTITRVNYKVRTIMSREDPAAAGAAQSAPPPRRWEDITSADRQRLRQMMEPLVRALFFQGAATYADRIQGNNGFADRVSQLGPRDSKGRSLRELDLSTRLPRYPLSYQIYSEQFDGLPEYALEYIHSRIVEVLQGRDTTGISASMTADERKAITEILIDTKPALAALLNKR